MDGAAGGIARIAYLKPGQALAQIIHIRGRGLGPAGALRQRAGIRGDLPRQITQPVRQPGLKFVEDARDHGIVERRHGLLQTFLPDVVLPHQLKDAVFVLAEPARKLLRLIHL